MKRGFDPAPWTGRVDAADGDVARRWHQVVRAPGKTAAAVTLAGFACDAGVRRNRGRPGAAGGPQALRRALAGLAAHGVDAVDDLGDVACDGDALEDAQQEYASLAAGALDAGSLVIGLGGGHEIAWASYRALAGMLERRGDGGAIGVVNFDAHFDLRGDARASSGTPFRQILDDAAARSRRVGYRVLGISRWSNTEALFQRARERGVEWVEDVEFRADQHAALAEDLRAFVHRHERIYLTICLDALPASAAPGVSAPAALGVDPLLVERLAGEVLTSGRVAIADVAELNPEFDIDGRTARLAARYVALIAAAAAQR